MTLIYKTEDNVATEFDQLVLRALPHFITIQYQRLLEAETATLKVHNALRVYELTLRTLAISVISQYLIRDADRLNAPILNRLLLTKLPNVTLDVWQQIFFVTLMAYEGNRDLFFMPELYDFFWDNTVIPPKPRQGVEVPFIRLTQIRNDLEHGASPAEEAGWQALCTETLNLLSAMLSRFTFLERYELIRVTKREGDSYWYDLYTGSQEVVTRGPIQIECALSPGFFYFTRQECDFLKLHPLFIFWEEPQTDLAVLPPSSDAAIYDRFIIDRLQYLIANMWKTVTDEKSVSDFVRLLYYTVEQVKQERQQADRLTWQQLREITHAISERRMASVLGKYRSNLYLQRNKVKDSFEDFLTSDKVCFVLTGKSGVGKSNFLLSLAEEYASKRPKTCLLMYNGAKLNPQEPITAIIGRDFSNQLVLTGRDFGPGIADIWQEIARIDDVNNCIVILCIDAINENLEAKAILSRIDELVEGSPWPWLKVVLTSRPEAWQSIKRGVRLADSRYYRQQGKEDLGVEMESFSYSEELKPFSRDELPLVYTKYYEVYRLRTSYLDLPSNAKVALQDPLILRLVADMYQGEEIPNAIRLGEIYQEYINHLLKTERLAETDLRFLEHELMPFMIQWGRYSNKITAREINEAKTIYGRSLFDLIHNDGILSSGLRINQSYINLVDTEILMRHGDAQEYDIGFKFERFYDHYAGKRIQKLIEEVKEVHSVYIQLVREIQGHPYLWGAVKAALLAELKRENEELVIALCQSDDQSVKEMMVATLTDYGNEGHLDLELLLTRLMSLETTEAASIAKTSIVGRLLHRESIEPPRSILNARKTAIEVAGNIGDIRTLQKGAMDRSSTVRTHAVRNTLQLWRQDREHRQRSTVGNRAFEVLRNLSKQIREGLLPNINVMEACAGIILPLFFEGYHGRDGNDDDLTSELWQISRKGLEDLLYIGQSGVAGAIVRNRVREWVVSSALEFVVRWIQDSPQHSTFDIVNLKTFFSLSQSERELLNVVLSYYDPSRRDVEVLIDYLPRILNVNDTIINWSLWQVLLVQWDGSRETVLRIIEFLFEEGMRQSVPTYTATVPLSVLAGVLRQGRGDETIGALYLDFTARNFDKSGGRVIFSGRTYVRAMFDSYFDALYGLYNKVDTSLPCRYVEKAVKDNNVDFQSSVIRDLGLLAPEKRFYKPILEIVQYLLPCTEASIRSSVVNLLARLRQNCPNEVDDFLLDNSVSSEIQRDVMTSEVKGTIGGDVLFLPVYRYIGDAAVFSPKTQAVLPEVLGKAVHCGNVSQFLSILVKKIINLVYGQNVFKNV